MAYKQGAEVDGVGGAGAVEYIEAGTTVTGSQDIKALETSVLINNRHLSLTGAVGESETPATLYFYSGVEGGNNIQVDGNGFQINSSTSAYLNGSSIGEISAQEVGLSGSNSVALHSDSGLIELSASSGVQVTGSLKVVGKLTTTAGRVQNYRTAQTTSITVETTDHILGVKPTTAGGEVTVNLPAAADAGEGYVLLIKDVEGGAGTNNIVVDASGSQTIDGSATFTIETNYAAANFFTDGSNWFVY